ncbi:MAG: hypothetical protein K5854_01685 [Prevotella sp.]|nr:hypothetical protein [Prevotella sp.]
MGKLRSYTRYCGIYGIEFIPHGEWADPELRYGRYLLNYFDVEDEFVPGYNEWCKKHNIKETDDSFKSWMYAHRAEVKEQCKLLISLGCAERIPD